MTEDRPHPPVEEERQVPEGSYAAGRIVRLPRGAERPISVFVNGVEQSEGEDFEIDDENVVFTREILKEEVGIGRWLAMFLGLFGTYRKHETVDVQFTRDGRLDLASDLPVIGPDVKQ